MRLWRKENEVPLNQSEVISNITAAKSQTSITKGVRVLVVGGGIDIATIMKGLSSDGFEADSLNDPEKALMNYEPESYDLVITDIRMAKMNGFELCRGIRKVDSKVKICLMTAFEIHLEEFEKVLPSIKVDGFITKPAHISTLHVELQRLLTVNEAG